MADGLVRGKHKGRRRDKFKRECRRALGTERREQFQKGRVKLVGR